MEVVAAIIKCGDKILCMQRGKGKYDYISYKYEFPGGKIEDGENQIEALQRELKEEMSLDTDIARSDYFMSNTHEYPHFKITLHSYILKVENPKFKLKEHKSYVWANKKNLALLDWAAADIPIVKELIKEKL